MGLQWILQNSMELNSKEFNDKQTAFKSTIKVIFHSISKFPWFWRVWDVDEESEGKAGERTFAITNEP